MRKEACFKMEAWLEVMLCVASALSQSIEATVQSQNGACFATLQLNGTVLPHSFRLLNFRPCGENRKQNEVIAHMGALFRYSVCWDHLH